MDRARSSTVLLAALAASTTLGGEGRHPIFQPGTISQPGYYLLTRDISVSSGDVITIAARDVTLDLNGRMISSSGSTGNLIQINDGAIDFTIRNGRLVGGSNGIHYATATQQATGARIQQVEIRYSAGDGIRLSGAAYAEISGCRIVWPSHNGIYVAPASPTWFTRNARIVDNDVLDPGWNGIVVNQLQGGQISGNMVTDIGWSLGNGTPGTGGVGILLAGTTEAGGNLLERNVVGPARDLEDEGIRIEAAVPHNLVQHNVVKNVAYAIHVLSEGNRIVGNEAGFDSWDVIRVGGSRNLVDGNSVGRSGQCGINFLNSDGHVYRNNMIRVPPGTTPVCGSPNTDGGGNVF